jgi:EAL domain-containing protein (putative c-di-GMP-specific phosphodiesterase class I)
MREADVAMYKAKANGKNRVICYDSAFDNAVGDYHALKADIFDAVPRDELVIDYQPVVELMSGRIAGVEALVRWQHPKLGLLPPSTFIGLAEETGAILDIGSWVLETACRQAQSWQHRHSIPDFSLSVNISVRQLEQPGFTAGVTDVLTRTAFDASCLVVEITESVLADTSSGAAASLEALRQLGVRVAIDDFGTGYSSIGYLRQLPIDILKIDRSFVSGGQTGPRSEVLLDAIVGL